MRQSRRRFPVVLFLLGGAACLLLAVASPLISDAATCEPWAAKVTSVQGTVESLRVGETEWQRAELDHTYCPGDRIRVLERSRADLSLASRAVMRLNENSAITVEEAKQEGSSLVDLVKGAAHFFSRRPASLEVKTPYTIAGVRGTEFLVEVDGQRTFLSIFEGAVVARNDAGGLELRSGQSAVAEAGKAPVLTVVARPRDAVSWALYYPPILAPDEKAAPGTARARLHEASELLSVGKVADAQASLDEALRLDPNAGEAYALQSIVATVRNEKDEALGLARKAVSTSPGSAAAHVALSYAQQARFDLEGARKSLLEAVRVEPESALAWARLAEVHAMSGDLGKALDAANRAVQLDPRLSRSQTVLGFARLMQVKTGPAKDSFRKAIAYDQADPMPRLGLGLAIIREGRVEEGGRELEIAASLDPNNSLIRSYLGKVYYEEKRTGLDEREYQIAKKLDPKDPTPWFYEAITLQTTNRPVEALHAYQKSIELNDNRAVYRSKLLLDSDEAARSAGLARIYSDLGFQQRALVEGWNAVNTDPTNHSAHRFLADSYSVLPRHEIARVSELLQSQLLQPLNRTPLQPRLGESSLFLLGAQGPGGLSFNEFNPLFNRDGLALQASGMGGEDSTWSGEGIVSGIHKKLSFSAGYSHFSTDGFRENNQQEDQIAGVFAQLELTASTSVQTEYRYRNRENGDLELRFFENDFSRFLDEETRAQTFRAGVRHAFTPSSTLLGSYIYQRKDIDFLDSQPDFGITVFDLERREKAHDLEAQYLFRSADLSRHGSPVQRWNAVAGTGYVVVDSDETTLLGIDLPPPPDGPGPITETFDSEPDVTHSNLYLYSYVSLASNLTVTLGASGDFFDEDEGVGERRQMNPKVGAVWNPVSGTTFRAAAFRALKRTLVTDQTLEPTQVAGFNQFFDDPSASDSWRYGAAVDQKITESAFAGLELSKRDLKVPFNVLDPETAELHVERKDWDEKLARAYFFWAPHNWVAVRADYEFERFERDPEIPFAFKELDTHRVRLGVEFSHPCGFGSSIGTTYLRQDGEFELREPPFGFESGDRDFWVVDAALKYRLPKRYGLVAIGANNLFDEDSTYQATDVRNPSIRPGRLIFAAATLALP